MTNHHLIKIIEGYNDKNGNPFKFHCLPCDYHTNKVCNLYTHLRSQKHDLQINNKVKEKKMNYCQFCPYKTHRPYCLKIHTFTQHENKKKEYKFNCDICNIGYDSIENYENHIQCNQHIKKQVKQMIESKKEKDKKLHNELVIQSASI